MCIRIPQLLIGFLSAPKLFLIVGNDFGNILLIVAFTAFIIYLFRRYVNLWGAVIFPFVISKKQNPR